jgi:hypothetical protein
VLSSREVNEGFGQEMDREAPGRFLTTGSLSQPEPESAATGSARAKQTNKSFQKASSIK